MVTQKEAIENYLQTQNDIETIKISIQNLEKIIEIKMDETKRDISENRKLLNQHTEQYQKNTFEFNRRLIIVEQFSNKVVYLYSSVVFLMGIIIGAWWKPL